MALLLTVVTFFSTTAGGLFALHHQDRLHLILGFAAGVMLGVVAFDLLPEIAEQSSHVGNDLNSSMARAMVALLAGFLFLHVLERTALLHPPHEDTGQGAAAHFDSRHHPRRGLVSALALSAHSFTDGFAIGIAFQAGTAIGLTVAFAVIAHDFADGLNTVTLMMV